MMWLTKTLAAALILLGTVAGSAAQDRPQVMTVNYALQFLAERLVGDSADVVFPVPDGTDPSFWRPKISDISKIQAAKLVLLNGAGFATWIDRVSLSRSKLVNTSAAIKDRFIVTKSITHSHGDGGEHSHEGLASYTWLDPQLAIAQAEAIAKAVTRRRLASKEEAESRLAKLRADLEALDTNTEQTLSGAKGVAMIATHPRYQYLARRYGLTIDSLEWEAGEAPSAEQLADLKGRIEKSGARVLIWEAAPPASAIDATNALGVKSVVFSPLAQKAPSGTFIDAYSAAVADLAEAAK